MERQVTQKKAELDHLKAELDDLSAAAKDESEIASYEDRVEAAEEIRASNALKFMDSGKKEGWASEERRQLASSENELAKARRQLASARVRAAVHASGRRGAIQSAINAAAESLKHLEALQKDCTITSPKKGILEKLLVHVGEFVSVKSRRPVAYVLEQP